MCIGSMVPNAKNKESMDLKEKVRNEVISARILAKTVDEAVNEIFSLFNVVGQSEQFFCQHKLVLDCKEQCHKCKQQPNS
jgi:hypothetical protein